MCWLPLAPRLLCSLFKTPRRRWARHHEGKDRHEARQNESEEEEIRGREASEGSAQECIDRQARACFPSPSSIPQNDHAHCPPFCDSMCNIQHNSMCRWVDATDRVPQGRPQRWAFGLKPPGKALLSGFLPKGLASPVYLGRGVGSSMSRPSTEPQKTVVGGLRRKGK